MTFSLLPAFLRNRAAALGLAALLLSGGAQAANDIFNGGAVSNCTYTSATQSYACTALSTSDNITIADGYTVVLTGSINFGFNQQLNMSGAAKLQTTGSLDISNISTSNLNITGGSLVAGTSFSIGAQAQTITANVTAASMSIGTGSATKITGTLTSTGPVTLASHATIVGPISGTTVTTNSPVSITGNVNASSSFTLASGSTMSGNITAPTVTLSPSSSTVTGNIAASTSLSVGSGNQVTGSVSGGALTMDPSGTVITGNVTMTGDVDIGSGDTINGNLTGHNVTTESSDGYISGNASVNSLTLNWHGRVGGSITCTGSGASGCSCVTNNSGYTSGSNAPSCAAPPSQPDHILITHSGSGLTCQPQTVTITACANAACTAPNFASPVSVTLLPNGPNGTTGQAFNITGSGTGSIQQNTPSSNATISATSSPAAINGTTCLRTSDNSNSCNTTFSQTNFDLQVPDQISSTIGNATAKIALRALQSGGNTNTCTAALTGIIPVKFICSYLNPGNANPNATASTIAIGNTSGTSSTPLSVCDGSTATTLNVSFDNTGLATPLVSYPDVGQVNLRATYTTATNKILDTSHAFVAVPNGFKITATSASGKICSSDSNVSGNSCPVIDQTGAIFTGAGQPFTTQISAVNLGGNVTPNFGRESSPESIDVTESLYAPSGGSFTASAPVWSAISNGTQTANNMYVDEVGIASFLAILHNGKYLNNSLSQSQQRPQSTLNVGRFVPDHFGIVFSTPTPVTMMACTSNTDKRCPTPNNGGSGPFVYVNQPFDMTITAYALAHSPSAAATTANYQGNYAMTNGTSITLIGAPSGTNLLWKDNSGAAPATPGIPAALFVNGVGASSNASSPRHAEIDFATAPNAITAQTIPVTLNVQVKDNDQVTSQTPLSLVSGRLLVKNAFGSPTSYMPVNVEAQYWTGTAWATNGVYATTAGISLFNGNTPYVTFSNCVPKTGGSCGSLPSLPAGSSVMFSAGAGSFNVSPISFPGAVDVLVSPLLYLPSTTGRLTFGVYKAGPVVYMREVF